MASAYTSQQLKQFLDYIELPTHLHDAQPSLNLLSALHAYTISRIPYENLSLHYNDDHAIDLDPQHLFRKVVGQRRGRGGYCMENAILYNNVLKALGFDAYTAPARNRNRTDGVPQGAWRNWVHITNIVTFADGTKYSCDVAFGGDGPTMPMPLTPGLVHSNLGTQEIRLVRDWMPEQTKRSEPDKDQYWIYQYRNDPQLEWNSFYAFLEMEFLPVDWDGVSWYTGCNPLSFQTQQVLLVLFLRQPKCSRSESTNNNGEPVPADQEIYGKRMLVDGVVKENLGGKTRVVRTCHSEAERVAALEEFFSVTLGEDEIMAIQGWRTELGAK